MAIYALLLQKFMKLLTHWNLKFWVMQIYVAMPLAAQIWSQNKLGFVPFVSFTWDQFGLCLKKNPSVAGELGHYNK